MTSCFSYRRSRRRLFVNAVVLLVLMVGAHPAHARDQIGGVSFFDGDPLLIRDGVRLAPGIDFGTRVENFDAFITDERSSVEIVLDRATGIDATITIAASTRLYLDVTAIRAEQDATVELVGGTVSVVARSLGRASRFSVTTPTAVFGVRGTTFTIVGAEGGDLLVVADEGMVEVTDADGRIAFASPGEAVEIDPEEAILRTRRYDRARRALFVDEWRRERRAVLLRRAERLIPLYAERYAIARERFIAHYRQLLARRDVFDAWMEEGRRGLAGRPIEQAHAAREIFGLIRQIRVSSRAYESLLDQLDRIGGVVAGTRLDHDVFRQVHNDRPIFDERFAEVRSILKAYALRHGGVAPRFLTDEAPADVD
ncbi:MAG: hypothetical protein EA382_11030 [Spirochaetaceae bacterium]|nr:MAG: hypothetical protein EA382_11030 [Spirochaetaceae bacterium]